MIIAKAEITFFDLDRNSSGYEGICAKKILRPAFNFGENLLFSGTVESDGIIETYIFEKIYVVQVQFPTIEGEAYQAIKHLIKIDMNLDIQNGSRIIGKAKLLHYIYKD